MIDLKIDEKMYGNQLIFKDFSLNIEEGEFIYLIGKSGRGKTTLLNILAAEDKNFKGSRSIIGKLVYLPQESILDDQLTLFENCRYALECLNGVFTNNQIENILSDCGIEKLANHFPEAMSGGERSRANLAAMLCMNPQILILDEPVAHLDPETGRVIMKLIQKLHEENGLTIILSTHNLELVAEFPHQIIDLNSP